MADYDWGNGIKEWRVSIHRIRPRVKNSYEEDEHKRLIRKHMESSYERDERERLINKYKGEDNGGEADS